MLGCKSVSEARRAHTRLTLAAATLLAASAGCSPRTLVLVDPCPNGGIAICAGSVDGSAPIDASNAPDASDAAVKSDVPITTLRQGLVGLWHFDESAGTAMARFVREREQWNARRARSCLGVGAGWTPERGARINRPGLRLGAAHGQCRQHRLCNHGFGLDQFRGNYPHRLWNRTLKANWQYPSTMVSPLSHSGWQAGNLYLGTNAVPSARVTAPPPGIQRFVWTHLAGTYDGSTAALYVDGVLVGSLQVTGIFPTDTTPLILGANGNTQAVSERFPGRIDEIALYNRALDANEIQRLASGVMF